MGIFSLLSSLYRYFKIALTICFSKLVMDTKYTSVYMSGWLLVGAVPICKPQSSSSFHASSIVLSLHCYHKGSRCSQAVPYLAARSECNIQHLNQIGG